MPISEAQVRTAKSAAKAFKLYDSEGLFLLVTPSGGKLWRLRFKFDGKEKLLTLGAYPKVGLAAARKKRNAAIEDIQAGIDPAAARAEAKAASAQAKRNTFKSVALEWHQLHMHEWTPAYAAQILKRLEADVFPKVGDDDIAEIKPAKMLEVLKAVEARGVLTNNFRSRPAVLALGPYAGPWAGGEVLLDGLSNRIRIDFINRNIDYVVTSGATLEVSGGWGPYVISNAGGSFNQGTWVADRNNQGPPPGQSDTRTPFEPSQPFAGFSQSVALGVGGSFRTGYQRSDTPC